MSMRFLPALTQTPETGDMGEGLDQCTWTLPARQPADPSEIAEAAVYLASAKAVSSTGSPCPWMEDVRPCRNRRLAQRSAEKADVPASSGQHLTHLDALTGLRG